MYNNINRYNLADKTFLKSIEIKTNSSNCVEYGQFLFRYKRYMVTC